MVLLYMWNLLNQNIAHNLELQVLKIKSALKRTNYADAIGTKPFLAKSLGDNFRESPFRQKRSKIKQAGHVSDFAGAAQSSRFSPCLFLYPFSPPPHLNNRPLSALPSSTRHYTSPSPPSIPLPVLWTPRHLSALMPPSPASLPPP